MIKKNIIISDFFKNAYSHKMRIEVMRKSGKRVCDC